MLTIAEGGTPRFCGDAMTIFKAVIMGIVQGLTEFLPVSSSGHLVLAGHFLGVEGPGLFLEVMLHFGTLIAVVVVFWQDIAAMIRSVVLFIGRRRLNSHDQMYLNLVWLLILGSVPAAVLGLVFKSKLELLFGSTKTVGLMLGITGVILAISGRLGSKGKQLGQVTALDALVIGTGQACALVPGLSRSGTTIGASLFRGLDRPTAARFSFLLAIPAVLGATVLELFSVSITSEAIVPVIVGTISAAVFGFIAIKILMEVLNRGRLIYFSLYLWLLSALVLLGIK